MAGLELRPGLLVTGGVRLFLPDTLPYRWEGSAVWGQKREGEGEGGRDLIEGDGHRPL